jgi:cardiolipin synthase A/B
MFVAFALIAWLATGALSAGHAIIHKLDPKGAALWTVVSFLLPVIGPLFYVAFGINRVERHAVRRLGRSDRKIELPPDSKAASRISAEIGDSGPLPGLRAVADRLTKLPLLPGNRLTPLHGGEQAYPEMLSAIRSAKHSVTLASYIFDWDDVGRGFTDALGEAARRGVDVRVLLDGIGAVKSFSRVGRRLLKSGARVTSFFPLRFPLGRIRINLRNHRKLLIIDGRNGFTGGMNISQRHQATSGAKNAIEDVHFKIAGPVVAHLQHAFAEDWLLACNEVLEGDHYFPTIEKEGPAVCRGISSGPDEHLEQFHWIVNAALASARERVSIATPYFVPSSALISAMTLAALRGVEVNLLLPSTVDLPYMRWVADAYLWQIVRGGVRVFRRPPPFVHTKLMVVDRSWVLLGSGNLDRRSFRLNFEFNVEAYDPELARNLDTFLDERRQESTEVTLEEIDSRSRSVRLRNGVVKLFSPYL